MENTISTIGTLEQKLQSQKIPDLDDSNYKDTVYHFEDIKKDADDLSNKLEGFKKDLEKIQKGKFSFEVSYFIIIPILIGVGIISFWLRREYIPWIASFLLFCFVIPICYTEGLECVYLRLSSDFCQSISNSIVSGITPTSAKGLGTYLSCPLKEARRYINTAIYEMSLSFDTLYNYTDTNWVFNYTTFGIDVEKRDVRGLEQLKGNLTSDNETLSLAIDKMIDTDEILGGLLSLSSCYYGESIINYAEETMCHPIFHHMWYHIIFTFFALLGVIIAGVGINKFIIVMRQMAKSALRGNKKFNDELEFDEED